MPCWRGHLQMTGGLYFRYQSLINEKKLIINALLEIAGSEGQKSTSLDL